MLILNINDFEEADLAENETTWAFNNGYVDISIVFKPDDVTLTYACESEGSKDTQYWITLGPVTLKQLWPQIAHFLVKFDIICERANIRPIPMIPLPDLETHSP